MKQKGNKILKVVGLINLIFGVVVNILMFTTQAWPTYLYFILCGIGVVQILVAVYFKNMNTVWQLLWSIMPLLALFSVL